LKTNWRKTLSWRVLTPDYPVKVGEVYQMAEDTPYPFRVDYVGPYDSNNPLLVNAWNGSSARRFRSTDIVVVYSYVGADGNTPTPLRIREIKSFLGWFKYKVPSTESSLKLSWKPKPIDDGLPHVGDTYVARGENPTEISPERFRPYKVVYVVKNHDIEASDAIYALPQGELARDSHTVGERTDLMIVIYGENGKPEFKRYLTDFTDNYEKMDTLSTQAWQGTQDPEPGERYAARTSDGKLDIAYPYRVIDVCTLQEFYSRYDNKHTILCGRHPTSENDMLVVYDASDPEGSDTLPTVYCYRLKDEFAEIFTKI
jgi:hypothetical protein